MYISLVGSGFVESLRGLHFSCDISNSSIQAKSTSRWQLDGEEILVDAAVDFRPSVFISMHPSSLSGPGRLGS
jgi:hypothetical protein